MTKAGALSRSFLWAASGTVLQTGAQVIALIALARLLSPYEFGVATIATLVTQLCLAFAEFGVAPFIVQFPALSPTLIGTGFQLSCGFGLVAAIAIWFLAPLLEAVVGVEELTAAIRLLAVVFLIRGWSSVQESLCQRELDFRFLARVDGWSFGLGYAVVSVACAMSGLSYWSVIFGQIGQVILRAVLLSLKHPRLSKLPWSIQDGRIIIRFGIGQTFARFGSYVGSQADSYVVATFIGVVPTGLYGRANQLVTMPSFYIGQVFDKFVFPVIARLQSDTARLKNAYLMAIGGASLISIPLAVLTWLFADAGVGVILGKQWVAAVAVVQILALAIPFRMLHKVSDPTARALGATYSRAWRQWLFAATVFFLGYFLRESGIEGVALAVVIAAILDAVLMVSLCRKMASVATSEILVAIVPSARVAGIILMLGGAVRALGVFLELSQILILICGIVLGLGMVVFIIGRSPRVLLGKGGQELVRLVRADLRSAIG